MTSEPTEQDLKTYVLSLVQRIDEVYNQRITMLEEKFDRQEQQNALLTQGYAEMAVLIQTVMQMNMDTVDPKVFHDAMKENGKVMLEVLRSGAEQSTAENGKFYPGMDVSDEPDATPNQGADS